MPLSAGSAVKNSFSDSSQLNFLTLIVSLEAIFLSTFILISQNHETRLSERRNQLDLQINLLTEQGKYENADTSRANCGKSRSKNRR